MRTITGTAEIFDAVNGGLKPSIEKVKPLISPTH